MAVRCLMRTCNSAKTEILASTPLRHALHTVPGAKCNMGRIAASAVSRLFLFSGTRLDAGNHSVINDARHFHSSCARQVSASSSSTRPTSADLLEAWYNEVKTFGTLTVHDVPFDVHIQPLNPMEYPEANKSIVEMFYDATQVPRQEGPLPGQKLGEMAKLYNLKVTVAEGGERMAVQCDLPAGVQLPLVCIIRVPLKFVLKVHGNKGRNVSISSMESDSVDVHLESGNCTLHGVKCGAVNIQCDNGNIISKQPLLGNVTVKCGASGSIEADRFQGTTVDCSTEDGNIKVDMLYAENSNFTSQSGDVHLGGSHGTVSVNSQKGNLTIDSLDGSLNAELGSGSADVFIARQEGVTISSKEGDVTLRFSQDISSSLDLKGRTVEKDESLSINLDAQGKGFLKSETDAKVQVTAPSGKISLKTQDWLASLKLHINTPS